MKNVEATCVRGKTNIVSGSALEKKAKRLLRVNKQNEADSDRDVSILSSRSGTPRVSCMMEGENANETSGRNVEGKKARKDGGERKAKEGNGEKLEKIRHDGKGEKNCLGKEKTNGRKKMEMYVQIEGPVKKKARVDASDVTKSKKAGKQKAQEDKDHKSNKLRSVSSKKKRACDSEPTDLSVASSSEASPVMAPDPMHAEMCGMLIESLATSRASSLPVSALYKSVMQSRPALKSERTEKEWIGLIEDVLEESESMCGVFGKVDSSGMVRLFVRSAV
jgi:hypothetical protein